MPIETIIKQIEFINEVHQGVIDAIKKENELMQSMDNPLVRFYNDGHVTALKYAITMNKALIEKLKTDANKTIPNTTEAL